jgi:16S rRNA processing protein RimM
MSEEKTLHIGHILGPYGLKGWVKIYSETRPKENIFQYSTWLIETKEGWKKTKVLAGKPHGKSLVASVEICQDRNVAEALLGCKIAITSSQLATLDDDEYYWLDLIGCTVINLEEDMFGEVTEMYETGGHDVMAVTKGEEKYLIPFVPNIYVKEVDLIKKQILVDWDRAFSE